MAEHRKVRARGGQVLVPVPALYWRRLGLTPGQEVWWHRTRTDELVLSVSERRSGGRPPMDAPCGHCEKREAELVRIRAQRAGRAAVDGRVYFNQGYQAAVSQSLKGYPALDAINARLRDIEAQLGSRRGPWAYRPKRGARSKAARAVEVVDAPVLVLPDGVKAYESPPPD